MDRKTALWALVAFFGAGLAFNLVGRATEDASGGVALLAQLVTLAAIVLLIVLIVRRSGRGQ